MANLGTQFNAHNVEPVSFDRVPTGLYKAVITQSEVMQNKTSQGHHLQLHFEVIEGEHIGSVIFEKLNLWNQSQKAAQIAAGQLSAIARAVNVMEFEDTSLLHNKPMMIKVVLKNDPQHGEQNEIKSYKSITTDPNAPSPGKNFAENHGPQTPPAANPANLNPDGLAKAPHEMMAQQ